MKQSRGLQNGTAHIESIGTRTPGVCQSTENGYECRAPGVEICTRRGMVVCAEHSDSRSLGTA